jgi:recombination protein RecA
MTHQSLTDAVESLRHKGLQQGAGPMPPALPSGQPRLDESLRTGGWPRGSLALLDGSGATTLALGSLAVCQQRGGLVAWIDGDASFDPATAAHLGVRLEWLLVVRPHDAAEAVELAAWLARAGTVDAFVLDLGRLEAARGLERLPALLARAGGVGLLLARDREAAGRAASVRVALERRAWLAVGRDLVGQRVAATVVRHRWALAGGRAELDLWFVEGRRIDPLLPSLAAPIRELVEERPALRVLSA